MSYFLWVEDFENSPKITSSEIFGSVLNENCFADDKRILKSNLKKEGVFIELSFQDGLGFIRENLNKIDYIILDIDLPAYSKGDDVNESVLELLKTFEGYEKLDDETEDEELLGKKCNQLKGMAGFYLYTELVVELGFPKQHILFCSNHGENTKSIQEAFKTAKIALPRIYEKANPEVQAWVKECHEKPYSQLRRGIIEGCNYIAKNLTDDKISFNDFISENEKRVNLDDARDYLEVLQNFLSLNESKDNNKATLYKLFIRTLTHEWEAADTKKIRGLAWIMKNTRNWIVHNSTLFSELDEQMVAYLFMVNMRLMFNFDDAVQNYEKILFDLFSKNSASSDVIKNKLYPFSKTYLNLKNLVLDERDKKNGVQDGFYFNDLANNIQQPNSSIRNEKQLFYKLLYQSFWLTTSNPHISTGGRRNLLEIKFWDFNYVEKPYLSELARHIYNISLPE
jgi:hypothetical protein